MRAHLYTAVYRYIRPLPPPPPQRIAARRKDPALRPMWDPLRSDPAQTSGCALPHPRPQVQVRLWGVGRPPPDDCTCRVKPRLKSPPPAGRQTGCRTPALRGAPLILEERRHSPFQVLDASAIEGIRGLAGESSSIYSCIQIYIRPLPPLPPPPPQRIAARRKDLGLHPTWDPPRSNPAQISGCALPHPRPQVQVIGREEGGGGLAGPPPVLL